MSYRNKTYIAAAWDEDQAAVEKLFEWNENDRFALEFRNVHDYKQSRDSSLYCSIKDSLSNRMDNCKLFIIVIGNKTNIVTKGCCYNCSLYRKNYERCEINKIQVNKSYLDFECDRAKRDYDKGYIKILVLYNASSIDRSKCPEGIRWIGTHVEMKTYGEWDYNKVKRGFDLAIK